jgi:hypothetical protein
MHGFPGFLIIHGFPDIYWIIRGLSVLGRSGLLSERILHGAQNRGAAIHGAERIRISKRSGLFLRSLGI